MNLQTGNRIFERFNPGPIWDWRNKPNDIRTAFAAAVTYSKQRNRRHIVFLTLLPDGYCFHIIKDTDDMFKKLKGFTHKTLVKVYIAYPNGDIHAGIAYKPKKKAT